MKVRPAAMNRAHEHCDGPNNRETPAGDMERSAHDGPEPLTQLDTALRAAHGPENGLCCFGFSVRSQLNFRFLRPGPGTPLHVLEAAEGRTPPRGELLLEWDLHPGRAFARFFSIGRGRYSLWIEKVGWFLVDPRAPSIEVPSVRDSLRREVRLWSLPMGLCMTERGDIAIHGAAIDVDGSAILLAAPGRHGKTTLAAAFVGAGHRLLSEDLTCCAPFPQPTVLPGPVVMRVRRDAFLRLSFPAAKVVAEDHDRVYLSVEEPHRGDGQPVPLRAIVFLRASSDETRMERVAAQDSLRDLWSLSFTVPTDASRTTCFEGLTQLTASTPVWNLHRRLRFDDLPLVVDRVITTCLKP
jgi:hypothetical protein